MASRSATVLLGGVGGADGTGVAGVALLVTVLPVVG
jgi:hypothetical protein